MTKIKEGYLIIAIVLVVSALGLYIAQHGSKLKVVYPEENPAITSSDFIVRNGDAALEVGKSGYEEAVAVFPGGKDLGMSSVYKTENPDCILTFNKRKTALKKIHLNSPGISTARGVAPGDPWSEVLAAYGPNYIFMGQGAPGKVVDFDAIYTEDRQLSIIFQIRRNQVKSIILSEEMAK